MPSRPPTTSRRSTGSTSCSSARPTCRTTWASRARSATPTSRLRWTASSPPRAHGKAAGILLRDGASVAASHARGFTFLGVGSDVSFVISGARREPSGARGPGRGRRRSPGTGLPARPLVRPERGSVASSMPSGRAPCEGTQVLGVHPGVETARWLPRVAGVGMRAANAARRLHAVLRRGVGLAPARVAVAVRHAVAARHDPSSVARLSSPRSSPSLPPPSPSRVWSPPWRWIQSGRCSLRSPCCGSLLPVAGPDPSGGPTAGGRVLVGAQPATLAGASWRPVRPGWRRTLQPPADGRPVARTPPDGSIDPQAQSLLRPDEGFARTLGPWPN